MKLSLSLARTLGAVLALSAGAELLAQGTFPPLGIDTMQTSSMFSVTINGFNYFANVSDPSTMVGRSAATTDGNAAAVPVATGACVVCQPTIADADITCWAPGMGGPGTRREVRVEMLSLNMCGTTSGGLQVCYKAGQPAWNELNALGQAGLYRNSFGEVQSNNSTGAPNTDFPAQSSWSIHGIVTIFPAPAGTSGVFYTTVPACMNFGNVPSFPPPSGLTNYGNVTGTVLPDGGGGACGALPIALFDAASGLLVGQINSNVTHIIGLVGIPTMQSWVVAIGVVVVIAFAIYLLRRRTPRLAVSG